MSLYAIADLHLSLSSGKPMNIFPGWDNHVERLEKNWQTTVSPDDTVVVPGDISWAINFEEAKADFDFINRLNGHKVIMKGNHDYWWNSMAKMNRFLEETVLTPLPLSTIITILMASTVSAAQEAG